VLVCCAWTCLLVVMERRGLLPLGRYYPMDGRFWSDAVRTLLEPGEALRVLVGPLLRAWAAAQGQAQIVHGWAPTVAPVAGSGPLLARITGAVLLGVLIPLVWIGGNRLIWQLRKRSLALAVLSGGLSLLVALVLAVAGVRSRPIREVDPELAAKLPAQSLILWDNMLELALYELVRNRPDLALAAADRALEMRPEAYQGWWYRAAALRDLGRLDEARVAARRVLEKEPRHVHALQLLRGVGP
jgi:tetratricopeptide (TPR) repeat protein